MSNPSGQPIKHPPNPLFLIVGFLLIIGGIVVMIPGIATVVAFFQDGSSFESGGMPELVRTQTGAFATIVWGGVVFTIGRYIWRGARRRGVKDRFGRLLIIVGYLLLGIGMSEGARAMGDTFENPDLDLVLIVAVWAVPGAIIAAIGTSMAKEETLMTGEVG